MVCHKKRFFMKYLEQPQKTSPLHQGTRSSGAEVYCSREALLQASLLANFSHHHMRFSTLVYRTKQELEKECYRGVSCFTTGHNEVE